MATTGSAPRRPQKHPDDLRERAVPMVQEIRRETKGTHGVISRRAPVQTQAESATDERFSGVGP